MLGNLSEKLWNLALRVLEYLAIFLNPVVSYRSVLLKASGLAFFLKLKFLSIKSMVLGLKVYAKLAFLSLSALY